MNGTQLDTTAIIAGEIVARASSPASSGGVPPRERNLNLRSSQRDAAAANRYGCATMVVSRCALPFVPQAEHRLT